MLNFLALHQSEQGETVRSYRQVYLPSVFQSIRSRLQLDANGKSSRLRFRSNATKPRHARILATFGVCERNFSQSTVLDMIKGVVITMPSPDTDDADADRPLS